MKKIILIAVLVIGGIPIALFVIGMGIGAWQIATESTVDCSKDVKCLPKYLNSCAGVKVIATKRDMTIMGIVKGIKLDVILSTKKIVGDGESICRVYMSSFVHKDQAATANMSTTEADSIDKILKSDYVAESNKRVDSCDYSEENWKYIGDEMNTLVAGSLLDHPKAENCTALVQDLSKMTPEEYQSAKEGYQRLLKTGSSAN